MRRLAVGLVCCLSLASLAQSSVATSKPRPLSAKQTDFFRYLHPIVRLPGFNPTDIPVDEKLALGVDVWEYNPSDECTFDNMSPSCKTKRLYLLVSTDSEFDPAFAVELGPSYGLEVESIEFRPGVKGCVLFKLKERVKVRTAQGTEMQSVPTEICLSERRLFK